MRARGAGPGGLGEGLGEGGRGDVAYIFLPRTVCVLCSLPYVVRGDTKKKGGWLITSAISVAAANSGRRGGGGGGVRGVRGVRTETVTWVKWWLVLAA